MRLMGLLLRDYELRDPSAILTPALLVYPEFVDANIETTLRVMGGDANRWRPHLKTAKMPWVVRRLLDRGVNHFKCATTRELAVILESGGPDVLIAYPMVGANARRVVAIARQHPRARISVLVENAAQAAFWKEAPVNVFLDVNPGMDRTGIVEDAVDVVVGLARTTGDQFRGIHYYDGHVSSPDPLARQKQGFSRLCALTQVSACRGERGRFGHRSDYFGNARVSERRHLLGIRGAQLYAPGFARNCFVRRRHQSRAVTSGIGLPRGRVSDCDRS